MASNFSFSIIKRKSSYNLALGKLLDSAARNFLSTSHSETIFSFLTAFKFAFPLLYTPIMPMLIFSLAANVRALPVAKIENVVFRRNCRRAMFCVMSLKSRFDSDSKA